MVKIISAIFLTFISLNGWSQPKSIGGVVPGKTTSEELRELVADPRGVNGDGFQIVDLKELDNKTAYVYTKDGVVYQVEVGLMFEPEILVALVSKYGKPVKKVGEIKKVVCQNKLGGKFDRIEGSIVEYWKPKEGVQATLVHTASECAESVYTKYIIYHEKTKNEVDKLNREERLKNIGNKVDKINKGI